MSVTEFIRHINLFLMNALSANIMCQLAIIEVAGREGWNSQLERDFIALGEVETLLLLNK